tara:strand:+ start:2308 stop:2448 length:141 start_codon:yes stop_codon:yes gene_type:complete
MKDSEIAGLAVELAAKLSDCLIEARYQEGMIIIHEHLSEKLKKAEI